MIYEPDNLLTILRDAKDFIKREDIFSLKELSNRTLHSASIHQDSTSITLAVIVYSLSKVIEKISPGKRRIFSSVIISHINHAISALDQENEAIFIKELKKLRKKIEATGSIKRIIQDVFKKASINKASKIYEHGISMENTARLLGISIWELAEYAGQSVSDIHLTNTLDIKTRLENAKELFS
jgi:hypothetical protein